jgi:plasmid maintenance system antidote protein VapI
MNDIKMNIKALAGLKRMSIEELANASEIDVNHLRSVNADRAKMTAEDLIKLSVATGVSPFNIETGTQQ